MSTTLPTRMGIAVPSVAEASRRLPSSVKADPAGADDVLVTSVAIAPPAIDEPVSPELALVDPVLRERLRALLPQIELELPPPLLRALPDPEPENAPPLIPPPELVETPQGAASGLAQVREVPVYVHPSRGDRFRSFAKAFALGAAAAAVVTVGVVAELGEGGPATPQESVTIPPRIAAPTPAPKAATGSGETQKSAKPAAANGGKGRAAVKKQARPAARTKAQRQATKKAVSGPSGAAGSRTAQPKQKQAVKKSAATSAGSPEPRRFAWAPVDGAVAYRVELFRGDEQVLEVRTKAPAYELASSWRHAGKTERLSPGGYKWYVWPVFSSGPAAQAVVQARLTVP